MFPGYGPRSLQASNLAPNGSNFPRVAREEWPSQARFLAVTCLNLPVNVSRCFLSAMFIFPLLPFAHFFIWCLRVGNAYVYCLGIAQLCPYLGGPVHLHLGVPIHCTLVAQYICALHLGGPIHLCLAPWWPNTFVPCTLVGQYICTLVAQYICALHLGGPVHLCLGGPLHLCLAPWWPNTFVPCTLVSQYIAPCWPNTILHCTLVAQYIAPWWPNTFVPCTLVAQYIFALHLGGPIHLRLHIGGPVHLCLAPWWPSTFAPLLRGYMYRTKHRNGICRITLFSNVSTLVAQYTCTLVAQYICALHLGGPICLSG